MHSSLRAFTICTPGMCIYYYHTIECAFTICTPVPEHLGDLASSTTSLSSLSTGYGPRALIQPYSKDLHHPSLATASRSLISTISIKSAPDCQRSLSLASPSGYTLYTTSITIPEHHSSLPCNPSSHQTLLSPISLISKLQLLSHLPQLLFQLASPFCGHSETLQRVVCDRFGQFYSVDHPWHVFL